MAITSSAKKANKVSLHKQVFNVRRKREMRDAIKDVSKAAHAGDAAKANELLKVAYKTIDKAAKRGVIKDNTAGRKKSRLTKMIVRESEKKPEVKKVAKKKAVAKKVEA